MNFNGGRCTRKNKSGKTNRSVFYLNLLLLFKQSIKLTLIFQKMTPPAQDLFSTSVATLSSQYEGHTRYAYLILIYTKTMFQPN